MAAQPDTAPIVLLVCTRDPRGRLNGRKTVLRTIIDSLSALGCRVVVAHFGAPETGEGAGAARYVALPGPSAAERLIHALGWVFLGRASLNEALYASRSARSALRDLARAEGVQVVVTDMLRTAVYGQALELPWIADLDDLLSRRYRLMAASYGSESNLLGYYRSALLRAALRFGAPLVPAALRREATVIARREVEVARAAHVTTLVSASEARSLGERAGRDVCWTPMAIEGPAEVPSQDGRPHELVFLGGLDYGPNLRSVRQFDTVIGPELERRGVTGLQLHVIGQAEPNLRASFSPAVEFRGYVDDLDAALQQYRAMLVPEVMPGGVKTKIVAAALNGTVVLAHGSATDGMEVVAGRHLHVWNTPDELADLLQRLRAGDMQTAEMARAAHDWAEQHFGRSRLRALWAAHLAAAQAAATRKR